jgi:lysine 2,3-aminomutase
VPVVDPARVDAALVAALDTEKGLFVAIHANHERELGDDAAAAIRRLGRAGVALVGQTVLLKGVNDTPDALASLLRRMVTLRIKPYYLHHGDLAPGTARFRTDIETGQALMRGIQGDLSGLCQPSYMLDLPGGYGKAPIGPSYLAAGDRPGEWWVTDFEGRQHIYPPRLD